MDKIGFLIQTLTLYDRAAFLWCMQRKHAEIMARIARHVSRCGDGPLYALVGVLVAWLDPVKGRWFLACGLLAFLLELPLYWILKNTIKRDRPFRATGRSAFIIPSDTFSFPSGHAAAACVMATLVSEFYPVFSPLAYSLAMMIGISRVLLGVHYFTDILAGMCLGITTAMVAMAILF